MTAPEISCASINFSTAARMAGFPESAAKANARQEQQNSVNNRSLEHSIYPISFLHAVISAKKGNP